MKTKPLNMLPLGSFSDQWFRQALTKESFFFQCIKIVGDFCGINLKTTSDLIIARLKYQLIFLDYLMMTLYFS